MFLKLFDIMQVLYIFNAWGIPVEVKKRFTGLAYVCKGIPYFSWESLL
jgi:hypothetical protein